MGNVSINRVQAGSVVTQTTASMFQPAKDAVKLYNYDWRKKSSNDLVDSLTGESLRVTVVFEELGFSSCHSGDQQMKDLHDVLLLLLTRHKDNFYAFLREPNNKLFALYTLPRIMDVLVRIAYRQLQDLPEFKFLLRRTKAIKFLCEKGEDFFQKSENKTVLEQGIQELLDAKDDNACDRALEKVQNNYQAKSDIFHRIINMLRALFSRPKGQGYDEYTHQRTETYRYMKMCRASAY